MFEKHPMNAALQKLCAGLFLSLIPMQLSALASRILLAPKA
jgi:hypothetical protein